MDEQVIFQTIFQFLQTTGILVGVFYYVTTLRNQSRARKLTMANQLGQVISSVENLNIFMELLEMEWEDFDDFQRKYDSSVNRDNYAKRWMCWGLFERMGSELYQGNVDAEMLSSQTTFQGVWLQWNKFKPIILEYRERYGWPDFLKWFEYLVDELVKARVRQGLPPGFLDPDDYTT
jgi:hypothetical protein